MYEANIRSVTSYQVAGTPWITGSLLADSAEAHIAFPFVTKSFTLYNSGSNVLRLSFDSSTNPLVLTENHYFEVAAGASLTYDVKCRELYVSNGSGGQSGFQLIAELTGIDQNRMYELTGSGINTRA